MKISAIVRNEFNQHNVTVATNDSSKELYIPPKANGYGSSVNGGELLMLSLATCFCNDIYREAATRNINVYSVEVMVSGEFGAAGEPGFNLTYSANVKADASQQEINDLVAHTDNVAEIHNTLRRGTMVKLISARD